MASAKMFQADRDTEIHCIKKEARFKKSLVKGRGLFFKVNSDVTDNWNSSACLMLLMLFFWPLKSKDGGTVVCSRLLEFKLRQVLLTILRVI